MTQQIARLRIELEYLEPRIWRQVVVSLTTNLRALHELIQVVMPWESTHLYQFTVGDRVYGEPNPEDADWGRKINQAKAMRLGTLIDRGIATFVYTYDFGDDWRHRVSVESVSDAAPDVDYPVFVGGERRAPPEDVGGPPGFMEFVEAMSTSSHPQHKAMLRWYGGPFNAKDFDETEIAARVREIALRRKVSLDAFQRSRDLRQG